MSFSTSRSSHSVASTSAAFADFVNLPVRTVSGVSSPSSYKAHISGPNLVFFRSGANRPKKLVRFLTSRSSSFSALRLFAGSTAWGKSMMTAPSTPMSTLKSDRSPWTTPAHSMRTVSWIRWACSFRASAGSRSTSTRRGAGWPSPSETSSITSTPSTKS